MPSRALEPSMELQDLFHVASKRIEPELRAILHQQAGHCGSMLFFLNASVHQFNGQLNHMNPNRHVSWIVGGKPYRFCCPPCVEEFVKNAKESPDALMDPESYVKCRQRHVSFAQPAVTEICCCDRRVSINPKRWRAVPETRSSVPAETEVDRSFAAGNQNEMENLW